jgi:hypothetical protein
METPLSGTSLQSGCNQAVIIHRLPCSLHSRRRPMKFKLRSPGCTAAAFSSAAQAQTEIQWWHSMTAVNGEGGQRPGQELQRQPEQVQDRAHLQGHLRRVLHRGRGRLPRRQCAPHPAGVRGRHRHHDGQQGRHGTGRQGHEGLRREVRPQVLCVPQWPATTPHRAARC